MNRTRPWSLVITLVLCSACGSPQSDGGGASADGARGDATGPCADGACEMGTSAEVAACRCDVMGRVVFRELHRNSGAVITERLTWDGTRASSVEELDLDGEGTVDQVTRMTYDDGRVVRAESDDRADGVLDAITEYEYLDEGETATVTTRYDHDADGQFDACDVDRYEGDQLVWHGADWFCDGSIDESYTFEDCGPPYLDCEPSLW